MGRDCAPLVDSRQKEVFMAPFIATWPYHAENSGSLMEPTLTTIAHSPLIQNWQNTLEL